jgi:biopolymer transport protein ExbD
MSWKVRHEGSPRFVEGLTLGQVAQGLEDGLWEPTDEVQGPGEPGWTAIENHPHLAEVAADVEPPPARLEDEETRLDMTALIDVCLVLLVFFILTTGYAAVQKLLEMGSLNFDAKVPVLVRTQKEVDETMLVATVRMEGGKPVIRLEDQEVAPDDVPAALARLVQQSHKFKLLIKHDDEVPWGSVVPISDAAKDAGIHERVFWFVPEEYLPKQPKRRGR